MPSSPTTIHAGMNHLLVALRKRLWMAPLAIGICTTSTTTALATAPMVSPGGIATAHTSLVAHWVKKLPQSAKPSREGLALRCFETSQHSEVIGVAHGFVVHAAAARLVAVIDDYDHYKDLFEDTVKVRVTPIPNGLYEYWEQKAPVIFLPNTRYALNTVIHDEMPQRKIWHSRLVSSNQLLGNDVFVAVYPLENGSSYYWEVDFINAKWGVASSIAMSSIWSGAVSDIALADLDIKLRAENPTWTYDHVRESAKKQLDTHPVDQCVKHRVALDLTREPALREP